MTCIVAIKKDCTVWLGGDRAATDGHMNRTIINDPKVFVRGEVGIGVCGSPKVLDALAHVVDLPIQRKSTARAFLVSELVPAIRSGLLELDAAVAVDSFEGGPACVVFDGEVLIAYRNEIYRLQSNFQLVTNNRGYDSIGSGAHFALGSLSETWRIDNPRRRVVAALQAAALGNAGVAPPFDVVSVKMRPSRRA